MTSIVRSPTASSLGSEPVLFERFGGREDNPEAAYVHEVASWSIYGGIIVSSGRGSQRRTPNPGG
jgi:hypothetical protein